MADIDEELQAQQRRCEERLCRVGSPRGEHGIVERVYRARNGSIALRAKVIMDSGVVRYYDINDIYLR